MNLQRLGVVCFATAIVGTASAQQVWKVNCQGGPGIDFTDFPPAVAAAAPGDTILLFGSVPGCRPGVPNGVYTATTIDKPLRVVGFYLYGNPPVPGYGPTAIGLSGVLTITGIPAGQQVLISNVGVSHLFLFTPPTQSGLYVSNCAGDVLIEDFRFWNSGHPSQVLRVENCANVVLRGCDFEIGGAPIDIIDSSVLLTTTAVYHTPPSPWIPYTQTAEALNVTNSTVTMIGSLAWGCDRYGPAPMGARNGVIMNQSMLRVGPESIVKGGWISGTTYASGYSSPQPTLCTVQKDPRASIPLIHPSGPPPLPTDIHSVYHAWVVADEPFDISVAGPSNGFALLMLGDMTPFPAAAPWGTLAVDPSTAILVDLVLLPSPQGYFEWTFHCPSSAPNAHAFAFQALTLSPSGQLGLTVPSPLTVGWEHGRIP